MACCKPPAYKYKYRISGFPLLDVFLFLVACFMVELGFFTFSYSVLQHDEVVNWVILGFLALVLACLFMYPSVSILTSYYDFEVSPYRRENLQNYRDRCQHRQNFRNRVQRVTPTVNRSATLPAITHNPQLGQRMQYSYWTSISNYRAALGLSQAASLGSTNASQRCAAEPEAPLPTFEEATKSDYDLPSYDNLVFAKNDEA